MNILRFPSNVRLCFFEQDVIVLNLVRRRYFVFKGDLANSICYCMNNIVYENKIPKKIRDAVFWLIRNEFALFKDEHDSDYWHFDISKMVPGRGVQSEVWQVATDCIEEEKQISALKTLEAYIQLVHAYFVLKHKGILGVLHFVKKRFFLDAEMNEKKLRQLAAAVNKAHHFFPLRAKCLTWSVALLFLALRHNIKCNLVIGVQNYPFIAHAWIECNGVVICDDRRLNESFSIILREPFEC